MKKYGSLALYILGAVVMGFALSYCAAEKERTACLEYGFEEGTEGFANCRMELDIARRQRGATIAAGAVIATSPNQ